MLLRLYYRSYASAIAEELGLTRQAVGRHVRALDADGLIQEDSIETEAWRQRLGGGTSAKWYALTDEGLEVLKRELGHHPDEALSSASRGPSDRDKAPGRHNGEPPEPRVEVHNFEVKVPVQKLGIEWLPNAAKMQNWTRKWDPGFHGVYLEVTTKHILLRAAAEAPTRAMAEGLCLRKLLRVMALLEKHYGCELGRPEFRLVYAPGKTKVGVIGHPLSRDKGYEKGKLATIDSTPKPGTIHPTDDPNDADRIVHMARRSENTERLLEGLVEQQTHFFASLSRLLRPDDREEPVHDDEPGMEIQ